MSYRLLVIGHKHRAWSTEHREKELMADKQEWLLVIRYWLLEREQRNSCSIYHFPDLTKWGRSIGKSVNQLLREAGPR